MSYSRHNYPDPPSISEFRTHNGHVWDQFAHFSGDDA